MLYVIQGKCKGTETVKKINRKFVLITFVSIAFYRWAGKTNCLTRRTFYLVFLGKAHLGQNQFFYSRCETRPSQVRITGLLWLTAATRLILSLRAVGQVEVYVHCKHSRVRKNEAIAFKYGRNPPSAWYSK